LTVASEENRSRSRLPLYGSLIVLSFIIAVAIAWQFYTIRSAVRWFAWSHNYKAEVLSQPSLNTELKHIEWDGWGWTGQDTTVYLVFDPAESLSTAAREHRPGKLNGIPCEVPVVDRLEKNWYTVQFYTNEWWGRRNALNCTGSGD
jgi:hypothetical protein